MKVRVKKEFELHSNHIAREDDVLNLITINYENDSFFIILEKYGHIFNVYFKDEFSANDHLEFNYNETVSAGEIQVGEFVRTKDGQIDKVINDKYYMQAYIECQKDVIWRNGIVKNSFNLIDLIEENDYVNGQLVEKIHRKEKDRIYYEFLENADGSYEVMEMCELKNIKSIVTHEQFSSLEYKVEEK